LQKEEGMNARSFALASILGFASSCAAPIASEEVSVPSPGERASVQVAVEEVDTASPGLRTSGLPHVVVAANGPKVLLDAAPDEAWSSAAPELVSAAIPVVVRRAVDPAKVPSGYSSYVGAKVTLVDAAGRRCEATVTGLSLVGRVDPEPDTVDGWKDALAGKARAVAGEAPLTRAAVAVEAWTMAKGGHGLVADLGSVAPGCDAPVAALVGEVDLASARDAGDALHHDGIRALRALPEWAEAQAELDAFDPAAGPWDVFEEGAPTVRAIEAGGRSFVWVSASHDGGCGGFHGDVAALFERKPSGLSLVSVVKDTRGAALAGLAVSRGKIALHFPETRIVLGGAEDERVTLDVPFFGCPC